MTPSTIAVLFIVTTVTFVGGVLEERLKYVDGSKQLYGAEKSAEKKLPSALEKPIETPKELEKEKEAQNWESKSGAKDDADDYDDAFEDPPKKPSVKSGDHRKEAPMKASRKEENDVPRSEKNKFSYSSWKKESKGSMEASVEEDNYSNDEYAKSEKWVDKKGDKEADMEEEYDYSDKKEEKELPKEHSKNGDSKRKEEEKSSRYSNEYDTDIEKEKTEEDDSHANDGYHDDEKKPEQPSKSKGTNSKKTEDEPSLEWWKRLDSKSEDDDPQCNYRGWWTGKTCVCNAGWTGNNCERLQCRFGTLLSWANACQCDLGAYGMHCENCVGWLTCREHITSPSTTPTTPQRKTIPCAHGELLYDRYDEPRCICRNDWSFWTGENCDIRVTTWSPPMDDRERYNANVRDEIHRKLENIVNWIRYNNVIPKALGVLLTIALCVWVYRVYFRKIKASGEAVKETTNGDPNTVSSAKEEGFPNPNFEQTEPLVPERVTIESATTPEQIV